MSALKVLKIKKLLRDIRKTVKKIRIKLYLRKFKEKGNNIGLCFPLTVEARYNVSIGNNSAIGTYCHIWGAGGVKIGNNVLIAAHCCITSQGHDTSHKIMRGTVILKEVVIEDNVWLGYNVTVLPGVTIGQGSVIGAGSVVTSDIPPYSIAVGNPAKVIKTREFKQQ
ncbi:MAG: acyltransferase [Bacteroidales bacterium]|jgi:acetyltransferase-like isoleucine patch superfamily enzyme|nr:acyltransferase [Bacteroidales bacterium]